VATLRTFLVLLILFRPLYAADVLTSREDDARTGASLHESLLNPADIDATANPGSFGKLFTYPLTFDGQPSGDIYAQPLYVSNVSISGHGVANVLIVGTMSNFLFALDADGIDQRPDGVLWQRSLGAAPTVQDVWKNCSVSRPCLDKGSNIRNTLGIMGTPVVDRERGIIFVVNRVLTDPSQVDYYLHAIDLHDGLDLAGSPIKIVGSALGVTFNPNYHNQRSGLAFTSGQVIVAFGSYADVLPYHGWVFSYQYQQNVGFTQSGAFVTTPDGDISAACAVPKPTPASIAADAQAIEAAAAATAAAIKAATELLGFDPEALVDLSLAASLAVAAASLKQTAELLDGQNLLLAANNCAQGGIWMGGRAPAIDDHGRLLVMVGNGRNDMDSTTARNFGNSLVALDPVTLQVIDFFTPSNDLYLNAADLDLGGSGPMVIPGSGFAVGGGKEGVMYLWNLNSLGHFSPTESGVVQKFPAGIVLPHIDTGNDMPGGAGVGGILITNHAGHIMGGPVFWPRPAADGGARIFNWSENSYLEAFSFNATNPQPIALPALSTGPDSQLGHPGGILALSANGADLDSGIIWSANYDATGTWVVGLGYTGALNKVRPGSLHAYAATDLRSLWSSDSNPVDQLGLFAKFVPPVVANGRVYMPTFSNNVVVYGLTNYRYPRAGTDLTTPLRELLDDDDPHRIVLPIEVPVAVKPAVQNR
jgi:hypothetical protein